MSHGRQIKVLGKGVPAILGDKDRIQQMLVDLVNRVGMRPLDGPHMVDVECDIKKLGQEPFEDEGGITGVIVLSTSHIAIHTWPLRPFFSLDLYSCRSFRPEIVMDHIIDYLGGTDVVMRDLSDSLKYPF